MIRGSSTVRRGDAAPPAEPPPVSPYWNEDWAGAAVPANWLTEVRTGFTTYAFPDDPLSTRGKVLRLRDAYDSGIGTAYNSAALQLVSLYRSAANSRSGYLTINEETWYRQRVMWPSGNAWCDGDEVNWTIEWHVDNSTQSAGGNSPGLYVVGGYPLTSDGTTSPSGMILRWSAVTPSSPTNTYWPNSDAGGAYATKTPIAITPDQWYNMLFHVIWSKDAGTGLLEWWVDGVQQVSRNMVTLFTNAANFNSASYHTFGLYNYRYNVTRDSTTYFDTCRAGSTEGSVAD